MAAVPPREVYLRLLIGHYSTKDACYKTSTHYEVAVWKDNFSKAYQTGLKLGKSYFLLLMYPSVSTPKPTEKIACVLTYSADILSNASFPMLVIM